MSTAPSVFAHAGGLDATLLDARSSHTRLLQHLCDAVKFDEPTATTAAMLVQASGEGVPLTLVDASDAEARLLVSALPKDLIFSTQPGTAASSAPFAWFRSALRPDSAFVLVSRASEAHAAVAEAFLQRRIQGIDAMLAALAVHGSDDSSDAGADPTVEPHECLSPSSSADVERVVEAITVIFEAMMLKRRPAHRRSEDAWECGGRAAFAASVRRYVAAGRRILFVLPAFPFKSSNQASKVLGELPDMGELIALRRLDEFIGAVAALHEPGAHLIVFSDGRVYCDLFRIPDHTTSAFKNAVRQLHSSPRISWSDLDMFYPGLTDDEKRVALEALFGTNDAEVVRRIREDADFLEVYCGFKKFMGEELAPRVSGTVKEVRTVMSDTAKRLMKRNYAYGAFVKMLFPAHVRLSIHPSSNTQKFSINLIGVSDWGTPWHNCAVRAPDGRWSMVRRAVAEKLGHVLSTSDEGLPYFQAQDDLTFENSSPYGSPTGSSPVSRKSRSPLGSSDEEAAAAIDAKVSSSEEEATETRASATAIAA